MCASTPGNGRADTVYGVSVYPTNQSASQWLNPAAFDAQTPYAQHAYGNLGYNALLGPGGK